MEFGFTDEKGRIQFYNNVWTGKQMRIKEDIHE